MTLRSYARATCFLLLLLLLSGTPSFALDPTRALTQYAHRIWQVPQGLPDATVTSILQTHDGYLWLGTETGLARFDGIRFSRLDDIAQTPLKRAWVRSLMEDPQHDLWVGTNDAGLIQLDNGDATQYLQGNEPHTPVQCLVPEDDETLWACTSAGIARLSRGRLTAIYGAAQGLPINNVRAACRDADGTLWVGGDGNRLVSWTGTVFVTHQLNSIPAYSSIRAVLCSGNAVVWVGTTNGLIRLERGQERLLTVRDGLADNWIYCLLQGRDGTLWVGTKDGFSRLRSDGRLDSYRTADGLSQGTVYSIYEDREGSLWVGTKRGLNQFLDGRTTPYTTAEGLPTNNVGPVLQDQTGAIWVGTLGAGLSRFEDNRRFSVLTTDQGLSGNYVYALADDQHGGLWAGTNGGLNHLAAGRVDQTYTAAQGLPENRIQFLFRERNGVLWIGTSAGLSMLVDGKIVRPKQYSDASHPSMLGEGEDNDGHFLEATEAGLRIYLNGQFREFSPDKAPLREVDTFYAGHDGLLWMGTLGAGLRLLKGGHVFSYYMRDGLFDNEIYGIAEDAQDRLWMASSKGIFSVNKSDLLKFADGKSPKVVSTPYSPLDGLRTIECKSGVQPVVWRMRDGRLWFSTIRGLLVLDPLKAQRNVPPPSPAIEDVIVNGQNEDPDLIENVPPGRKDLEFRYTAPSFLAPAAMTFRYTLDGYDKNWTDAGTRRVAYYTNLPPGRFLFRVKACDAGGLCNETESSVAFGLASSYYQRAWFLPLCAAILSLAIWLAWRWRVRMLNRHFEIALAERGRVARELHDTLLQGFSGITMGMQAVSTGLPECEEKGRLHELIQDAAHCLKQARQAIAGLRGVRDDDVDLHVAIAKAARQIVTGKDIQLKLHLDHGPSDLPADVTSNLLRIAQEAMTNSMRHSGATAIQVSLSFSGSAIHLSVKDDGRGFNEMLVRRGHYGLAGMKERAEEIGAHFQLLTEPLRGTTVSVLLPVTGE